MSVNIIIYIYIKNTPTHYRTQQPCFSSAGVRIVEILRVKRLLVVRYIIKYTTLL